MFECRSDLVLWFTGKEPDAIGSAKTAPSWGSGTRSCGYHTETVARGGGGVAKSRTNVSLPRQQLRNLTIAARAAARLTPTKRLLALA